jgi:baculoviral IAP repeat-containing protein 2/3
MAIGLQSIKQNIPSNSSNRTTLRQIRRTKPDLYRLATFKQWKTNTECNVSPAVLSKVGFLYTGKGDKVRCDACDLEIDSWKPGMDPKQEHMERSPQCPFVLAQHEMFKKTDQSIITFPKPTFTYNHVLNSDYRGYMDHGGGDGVNNDTINRTRENKFFNFLSTETVDRARTYTFLNWPSITPSTQEMTLAGWWYTNIADRVMCIHCDIMFHNWNETDRPYEIHRLKSPQCFYVRMKEEKGMTTTNIPVTNSTTIITTTNNQRQVPTLNEIPNGQTIVGAVHAEYSLVFRRHQTFQTWPEAEQTTLPSIDSFVEAGFFYTGDKTIVRCFYCNGALRNWQTTDDPKVEHARWFPQCQYIRQFIGEDLYQAIQRKNRELRAQQNLQERSNGETSQCIPWTNDEIDRMVKARLDLPVVEKLRQEGYSMAIIRKVYEMQLKFKKDDFKTDVDLRVACLILDKQVKLINGNEANILIPQNWLKKYLDDQEKGIDQKDLSIKPTIETRTKEVETPKIITTVATRPRVLPKTSTDEQSTCVLCLTTERQVACLPCGHLTSCVACGHSLKTCPICRAPVKAFVRIYT